jgi:nucleotide-binding universal stress UspA family protein
MIAAALVHEGAIASPGRWSEGRDVKRFRNILVVAEESGWLDAVAGRAARLATANGAQITLVDVLGEPAVGLERLLAVLPRARAEEVLGETREARLERLETLAAPLRADGIRVETAILEGKPFIALIRQVMSGSHDLLLKGASRGADRPYLRALDLHLLRKCPCPVWILNGETEPRASRIMAAVDPDPGDAVRDGLARTVMQLATSLADQDDARIDVLNVWDVPEEAALRHGLIHMPEAEISAVVEAERGSSATRLKALTVDFEPFADRMRVLHLRGPAADTLVEHVDREGIDTLVMGTVGRTGVAGFFIGNTAETVLTRVGCSVLAVKPEGFVSPVEPA